MYNYTPQATHHAKFDFDPTTWVVWANSLFATVSGVFLSFLPSFLPFFVCFLRLAYKSRRRMNRHHSALSRRVLRQGCAFWGLEYLIFTLLPIFHQKSSKLFNPEIGNIKPKCWNMKYKIFQKLRNRTAWKFNTKLGTWNAVFGCNMMTS